MKDNLLKYLQTVYLIRTFVCAQWCLTLSDCMDCGPPGSSVHGFPRQEYWNGLPFPSPEDLPHPGIKPLSPVRVSCIAGRFFTAELSGNPEAIAIVVWICTSLSISDLEHFFHVPVGLVNGPFSKQTCLSLEIWLSEFPD